MDGTRMDESMHSMRIMREIDIEERKRRKDRETVHGKLILPKNNKSLKS